eukprot:365733-Chlamydomonas_euryale.AAC.1
MPARRSGYGQPNSHTRLDDEDKSLFVAGMLVLQPMSRLTNPLGRLVHRHAAPWCTFRPSQVTRPVGPSKAKLGGTVAEPWRHVCLVTPCYTTCTLPAPRARLEVDA